MRPTDGIPVTTALLISLAVGCVLALVKAWTMAHGGGPRVRRDDDPDDDDDHRRRRR